MYQCSQKVFFYTNLYSEVDDENDNEDDEDDDLLVDGGVPEDDIEVESQE